MRNPGSADGGVPGARHQDFFGTLVVGGCRQRRPGAS
jgi:hypothetical protein